VFFEIARYANVSVRASGRSIVRYYSASETEL